MARNTSSAPRVAESVLRTLLHEHWPHVVPDAAALSFHPLNSECDLNLRVSLAPTSTAAKEQPGHGDVGQHHHNPMVEFLLKVSNASEDPAIVDMQNKIMQHVEASAPEVLTSRLVRTKSNADSVSLAVPDDKAQVTTHICRLLTFLPGKMFALASPHSDELLASLGRALGQVDACLAKFTHPAADRVLRWDLMHSLWAEEHVDILHDDSTHRGLVKSHLAAFRALLPTLGKLRKSVIHNDANDYNIVVQGSPLKGSRKLGLIDWGDAVLTCTVFDLAIGLTYALLDKKDPIAAAVPIVAAYHSANPLTEIEVELLPALIATRLSVSVTNSAFQKKANPANEYLLISERPAWALLHLLATIPQSLFRYALRAAVGLEPVPAAPRVKSYLAGLSPAPLVGVDFRTDPFVVLDASIASTTLGTADEILDTPLMEYNLFRQIKKAKARVGVGRYNEVRPIYMADAYKKEGNNGPEWRTVHIGIDLFMEAGSPLFAPIAGTVHSVRNNAMPQDYGPCVILEHATPEGVPFYTLYGHLSEECLSLTPGTPIAQGQQFCRIGNYPTNGDWPPHVHFQIILDMLGKEGDFPGVAFPSQRALWLSLCPNPCLLLPGIGDAAVPAPFRPLPTLLAERGAHLGFNLSTAYKRPLHIVRGVGPYLYDEEGRAYLDAVNNVAHVGHCHPRVVKAGAAHMTLLNTNTRYVSELPLQLIDRLRATLPPSLSVFYFVCSGSEANDLALRIAAAHTKHKGVLCLDVAYHGHSAALIDVSPYKHNGPGGSGPPPHVATAPLPNLYSGVYRGPHAAQQYADDAVKVAKGLAASSHKLGAFIHESVLSCGGQVPLPSHYLATVYAAVRGLGGVCIADEVQTGFGRPGSHFWAFETQGVVPDIVTLGKPMGNGHPIAAVICTPDVARSFANGMEYFNTFGGNPVSCAIALEVLSVIADEKLQARAADVGSYLLSALLKMQERHAIIGDVRGVGLFIGIELVTDRTARSPAADIASHVANRMRDLGILLSTDGPHHNVLKIKPPLVWQRLHADFFVATLDRVLGEDACQL